MTALELAPLPVLLVTRAPLGRELATAWAQGGVAAAVGKDDAAVLHAADTHAAGDGICDPDIVSMVTGDAPASIRRLERFGVRFDRDADMPLVEVTLHDTDGEPVNGSDAVFAAVAAAAWRRSGWSPRWPTTTA